MRRILLAAGFVLVAAVLVLSVVVLGNRLASKSNTPPTPTPVPTITITVPTVPPSHPRQDVHLPGDYKAFVSAVCRAISRHDPVPLENNLIRYQFNQGVYWGGFNRAEGTVGNADLVGAWLGSGNQRCVRVAAPYLGHGVLVSRGWSDPSTSQYGTWALFDLDKQNGAWKINDETFGSYAQVMGSFFANWQRSVGYPAGV